MQAETPISKDRLILPFLDGLRALAALYVLLYPSYTEIDYRFMWGKGPTHLPGIVLKLSRLISYGHQAVAVFIVLSGFCLMLPVAYSATGELRGGTARFFQRRARRILPPYYAALLFSMLITLLPFIAHPHGIKIELFRAPDKWDVPAHLLLIHNLFAGREGAFNGALWSVGLECQIYLFFPLLLLPLWRRFGLFVPVLVAFLIGFAPHFLGNGFLDGTLPWYLGLFALGMAAAVIAVSPLPRYVAIRERTPWRLVAVTPILLFLVMLLKASWLKTHFYVADPLVGISVAALLILCTQATWKREKIAELRLLENRGLVRLGLFSYSLYLIHAPIQSVAHWALNKTHFGPLAQYAILLGIVAPAIIGMAYLFHLVFERPFMSHKIPA